MPLKPNPPCSHPRCPYRAADNSRYCATHAPPTKAAEYPRESPARRGYGRHWQKLRLYVLNRFPVCPCNFPATLVHHIKPLAEGGTNDLDNLQSLCKPCHDALPPHGVHRVEKKGGGGRSKSLNRLVSRPAVSNTHACAN